MKSEAKSPKKTNLTQEVEARVVINISVPRKTSTFKQQGEASNEQRVDVQESKVGPG